MAGGLLGDLLAYRRQGTLGRRVVLALHHLVARHAFRVFSGFRRCRRAAVHHLRGGLLKRSTPAGVQRAAVGKEIYRREADERLVAWLRGSKRLDLTPVARPPEISVVLVLFNQAGLTLRCLESLRQQHAPAFETLILDNASTDATGALLDRIDGATVVRNTSNVGFLTAVNQAVSLAQGRYLLLLNNDTVVREGALAAAAARLAGGRVGAVGGRIDLLDGTLQEAGSIIWRDGSCLGYGRGERPGHFAFRAVREVDYVSGAFLMTPRATWEEMGGFNVAFRPAYYEDADYCARLWQRSLRVIYDPKVVIQHFEFASSNRSLDALDLQARHRGLFAHRHRGWLEGQHQLPEPDAPCTVLAGRSRHRGPRVLVVDDRIPHSYLGRGYPRAKAFTHALVAAGFDVTFYPLQHAGEAEGTGFDDTLPESVETVIGEGRIDFEEFARTRLLKNGAPTGYYSHLVVSRPHNMALVQGIRRRHPRLFEQMRVIYDAEAVFAARDALAARVNGSHPSQSAVERALVAEMALADGVSCITAVSNTEAALFRHYCDVPVRVVGHALSPNPGIRPWSERPHVLFVGALEADGTPNADAIVWFIDHAWPGLKQILPVTACLDIVGVCEAPSVCRRSDSRIRIHGSQGDLGSHYDRARVFVAPTRFAAGIPHKVHEAAAHGVPCVVTPLLAQQLGWGQGAEVAVAESAADFVVACARLFGSESEWRATREAALRRVAVDCSEELFRLAIAEAVFGPGRDIGRG